MAVVYPCSSLSVGRKVFWLVSAARPTPIFSTVLYQQYDRCRVNRILFNFLLLTQSSLIQLHVGHSEAMHNNQCDKKVISCSAPFVAVTCIKYSAYTMCMVTHARTNCRLFSRRISNIVYHFGFNWTERQLTVLIYEEPRFILFA